MSGPLDDHDELSNDDWPSSEDALDSGARPAEAAEHHPTVAPEQQGVGPPSDGGRPPQPSRSSKRGAAGVVMAVLLVVVVALGVVTWVLWSTLSQADQALVSAVNTVAAISGTAADPARLAQVLAQVKTHNYEQVVRDVQQMLAAVQERSSSPTAKREEKLPPVVPPEVRAEVSPAAAKFFEGHPELMRRALALAEAARRLRDSGVNVDELRRLRDQMLNAAERGDVEGVREIQDRFAARVKQLGGQVGEGRPTRGARALGRGHRRGELPPNIKRKLAALRSALEKAAKEGRDIRKAVRLAQRSEQAANRGDMRQAEELLDQALKAAKHAPKRKRPRGRPGAGPAAMMGGRGPNPLRVLDMLIDMVRAEEVDLSQAYDAMENAEVAVREKNQSQLREILQRGIRALDRLAKRRRRVSLAIERGRRPPAAGPRGGGAAGTSVGPGAKPVGPATGPAGEQGTRPTSIANRLVAFLEQVREMPQEEFEANKRRLAAIVFSLFLPPRPRPNEPHADQKAVERVRKKLRLAAGPYMQRKMAGEDVSDLDELFAHARSALYSGDVQQADRLVDEALKKLGLLVPPDEAISGESQAGQSTQATRQPVEESQSPGAIGPVPPLTEPPGRRTHQEPTGKDEQPAPAK